jgi:hypothetical protein
MNSSDESKIKAGLEFRAESARVAPEERAHPGSPADLPRFRDATREVVMVPKIFSEIYQKISGNRSERIKARRDGLDEEVAKRRAIVMSNPSMTARELCEIFDRRRVTLPKRWKDAGIDSWTKAYRQKEYRSRVQTLISKDRSK